MTPDGWLKGYLKNIASIKSGATPLRSKGERYFTDSGLPWVKTMDLTNSFITKTDEEITQLALDETSCSVFPINTILIAMYGGFNQIGRTGLLTKPSAINQAISGLVLDDTKTEPLYILNWLNFSVHHWKRFAASSRKDPNITRRDVCSFPILLPPKSEQTKIADILSTWDKAIEVTEKMIENSRAQKKALMQQLLTGEKRLKGFNEKWKQYSIMQMGTIISGGTPDTRNQDYWDGSILWITPTDITALKNRFILNTERKITESGVKNSSANILPKGSLLVCTRATVGFMGISCSDITTNQGFKSLVPNKEFNVNFLYYLFTHNRNIFIRYACGSTFLELSKKDFSKLTFFCPELKEQQEIANTLSDADKEIEILQQKLNFLQQEKKALMQQLLTGKRRVNVEGETN